MVKSTARALDATFAALADPTRRAMLMRLSRGSASISQLAKPFRISLPAVSKHVRVLEQAGLLARARAGREHRCSLAAEPIRAATDWMAQYRRFWEEQLEALEAYLTRSESKEDTRWPVDPSPPPRRSRSGVPSRRLGKGSSTPGRTRPS